VGSRLRVAKDAFGLVAQSALGWAVRRRAERDVQVRPDKRVDDPEGSPAQGGLVGGQVDSGEAGCGPIDANDDWRGE
jgi:hypothetical protein